MVQTRKGASNSEWLQFIKECGVIYRERKLRLLEEEPDPEIQNALPTLSPTKTTTTTTTRKRKLPISPTKAVDAPGDCDGASAGGGKAQETAKLA